MAIFVLLVRYNKKKKEKKIGKSGCLMLDMPLTTCMENGCSPGCRWRCLLMFYFVLSFFPRDVFFDEIWD